MRAAGAVLAAGASTRFGATKQLARLDGEPLVAHVVTTALAAGLDPVLVVVGHEAAAVAAAAGDRVQVVANPDHAQGQASSLHAAVRAATATDADALVVLLADEPHVGVAAVRAVLGALAEGAVTARARYDDRPGHPVGFRRSAWPALLETRGDQGARQLLSAAEVTSVRVDGAAPVDVDTRADLHELR